MSSATWELEEQLQEMFGLNPLFVRARKELFAGWGAQGDDVLRVKTEELIKDKPKPFVKWVGGKRQLAKQFREMGLYPPKDFDPINATYYEPFVGGGAMFFDALPLANAVLSDMNAELITTYHVIRDDVDTLIKKLKEHKRKNTKEYFLKVRAQNLNRLSDVSIAARFIYLNRTCFNGLYRVNKSGGFNVPYGDNKNPLICDEVNLRKVSDNLRNVQIEHEDYKSVLERAQKGDFVYFDPPYAPVSPTASFTSYTKDGFGEFQQQELCDVFWQLHQRGCFVMLSNSNCDFINEIYGQLTKKDNAIKLHQVFATRAINSKASGRGKIKEVVVTNY
jgi:DNA adenine methylase